MEINSWDDLERAILRLKADKIDQRAQLASTYAQAREELRPMTILRRSFSSFIHSRSAFDRLINAAVGVGTGALVRKLWQHRSNGFVQKFTKGFVELGIGGLVAQNTQAIKLKVLQLLNAIFNSKRSNTVK